MNPYVGITGFTHQRQIRAILGSIPQSSNRVLMAGVLASSKTLSGKTNKFPHRYPKIENIGGIFLDDPRVLNLVRYHTDDRANLVDQLIRVTQLAGPRIHGIQLNVSWPDPIALQKFSAIYPYMRIVLQIGNKAFGVVEHSPTLLAQKVKRE